MQYETTIAITPEQLQNIVADYLTKEGKKIDPKNIKFEIGNEYNDRRDGFTTVFRCCKVTFIDGE